ncbi:MAG: DUF2202 domain-containing protein [Novosphingobium sp.]
MSAPGLEQALLDALDDERKAEAAYDSVIERFGPVRPFINIVEAEARHSAAVERQMRRLGVPVPPNPWPGRVQAPASLKAACAAAIEGEIENIAMYDRLLENIADGDVRQTFLNLRSASHDNHLPAFRRCLARETGRG